ncbi:hypothetical protein MSG28_010927 [Choristoneura fumiferana]|uniref:Uncharacterized protein n=1 Tax=Choristoneura fumiferana TaxID=7141 RepID=A0ACC0KPI7_CHOFU|nr:hypothetical protein MSG28_010927 [Choristoneura fumiferana]
MSVILRGIECFHPKPRYGQVKGETSVYYQRPRCGQPRPQPMTRQADEYKSEPSNAPKERPCCYDYPCKADCFNHGGATRPSGRYARTVWYPGEVPAAVPPCQAFSCPNPPFHPYHAATTTHAGLIALTTAPALAPADATLAPSGTQESAAPSCLLAKPSAVPTPPHHPCCYYTCNRHI